jgi:signal transduction histidine kinase
MQDVFTASNQHDPSPRRRVVLPATARPQARAGGVARPGAVAAQAAAVQACARGEIACRAAWQRVCALGADGLLALERHAHAAALASDAMPSYGAIAADVIHMLAHGVGPGSARALVLLAALASARFNAGAAACAVADAAVTLAGDSAEGAAVRRLHAALVMARHEPFAACLQVLGNASEEDASTALLRASLRCAAGAPLPETLQTLEQAVPGAADSAAHAENMARLALLRALVLPQPDAVHLPPAASFGAWVLQLQLAWFSGQRTEASHAALAAAPLATALAAPSILLGYHLFAVLALAWDAAPRHAHALRWHRAELDGAARLCPANAGALAALAGAVARASAGDVAGALRDYEGAASQAEGYGQAWLAALAWELAAALCQQCSLKAAIPAYRRRALAAWHACGAHGRIARLCQGWQQEEGALEAAPALAGPCGEHEDEARRVARAGTVGELGVSIAHEVNQPLAAILLQAAAARRWLRRPAPDLDKALEALEQIAVSGRRAGDIVRSVQGLAQRHATGMTAFPVDAALDEALRLLGGSLKKHGVAAELSLELSGCTIHANRPQLQQVVINLLLNAIDALATVEGRARQVVLASRRLGPGTIEISVADNGPGVAPADRERIFGALFSTKRNGTGVGLSISRAIAEAHGGHIEYRPRAPHGALFSLVLATGET